MLNRDAWLPRLLLPRYQGAKSGFLSIAPGAGFCVVMVLAAQYITENFGGPTVLLALLLGMALSPVAGYGEYAQGIDFCSRSVLRVGVALLGVNLTFAQIAGLGLTPFILLLCTPMTIAASLLFGRLLGVTQVNALISGCAVGICGVSAAMAVAAVVAQNDKDNGFIICTLVAVAGFSTLAMVLYPAFVIHFGWNPEFIGLFLGASIHDVAQVVGAGNMISADVGQVATYMKMLRVAALAPILLLLAVLFRSPHHRSGRLPIEVPGFLVVFFLLVLLTNTHLIQGQGQVLLSEMARVCMLMAMVALGTRVKLAELWKVGRKPVLLLLANSLLLVLLAAGVLFYLK